MDARRAAPRLDVLAVIGLMCKGVVRRGDNDKTKKERERERELRETHTWGQRERERVVRENEGCT